MFNVIKTDTYQKLLADGRMFSRNARKRCVVLEREYFQSQMCVMDGRIIIVSLFILS